MVIRKRMCASGEQGEVRGSPRGVPKTNVPAEDLELPNCPCVQGEAMALAVVRELARWIPGRGWVRPLTPVPAETHSAGTQLAPKARGANCLRRVSKGVKAVTIPKN